jgi:hypothetical protein
MQKRTDITASGGLQGFAYDRLGLTKWKKLDDQSSENYSK